MLIPKRFGLQFILQITPQNQKVKPIDYFKETL